MDAKMTPKKWDELSASLLFRRAQLVADLNNEDYSELISIAYSKNRQLDAIEILLGQVPVKYD